MNWQDVSRQLKTKSITKGLFALTVAVAQLEFAERTKRAGDCLLCLLNKRIDLTG
jgi:hypothetical protein